MDGDELLLSRGVVPGSPGVPKRSPTKRPPLSLVWCLWCSCLRKRHARNGGYEEQPQSATIEETAYPLQQLQQATNPMQCASNVEIVPVDSYEDHAEEYDCDDEEEEEPIEDYVVGGYHPVSVGDIYDDRYRVLEKLGWGVYSTVWRCRADSRDIALKIQKSAPEYTNAALNEIEILKAIHKTGNKANVVSLLEHFYVSGPHGNHVCMVFEVLGSTLLRTIHENGRLEVRRVRKITSCLLECLNFIHDDACVLHTDIKPENILLLADHGNLRDQVKLVDLGTAFFIDKQTARDIQTREYRCPEGILGIFPFLPTADIWSVGCLVFELLTSETLFDPQSPRSGEYFTKDESHLAQAIELLGPIPLELLERRTRGHQWFTQQFSELPDLAVTESGEIPQSEHGPLLANISVQPPASDVDAVARVLTDNFDFDYDQATEISGFLKPLLEYQPSLRARAKDARDLPWLTCDNEQTA